MYVRGVVLRIPDGLETKVVVPMRKLGLAAWPDDVDLRRHLITGP